MVITRKEYQRGFFVISLQPALLQMYNQGSSTGTFSLESSPWNCKKLLHSDIKNKTVWDREFHLLEGFSYRDVST